MKKIFALILVVLMLVPFVFSCKQPDTNTDTDTNTNTDVNTDTDAGSSTGAYAEIDKIKHTFVGQTVNILAPGLWASATEPSSPWGQVELCVTEYGGTAGGFGQTLNDAVMDRKIAVEEEYGVTLNWMNAKGDGVKNDLLAADNIADAGGKAIHVALPRTYEAQTIAYSDLVYNIAGSEFIDFEASYFNQESIEQYTLAGNQFFIGGDMSFLDEHTAFVIYVNMSVAKTNAAFPDLFEDVLPGEDGKITWTIDRLYDLSAAVGEDKDGNKDEWTDLDKYGFGTTGLYKFYQYFGTYQVGKQQTNAGEKYVLKVKNDNVETIISKMLYSVENEDSVRTSWAGYGTLQAAFEDNRLLFYHEVVEKLHYLSNPKYEVAVIPFPKLNEEQDRYYVPSASQSTVMCVPRATDNRDLSEAFVEILTKSASEHIFAAYKQDMKSKISANYREKSMQVIEEQIFPNLMFDLGYMHGFSGLVSGSIQGASIEGGKNVFSTIYQSAANEAATTLNEWTGAYNGYVD